MEAWLYEPDMSVARYWSWSWDMSESESQVEVIERAGLDKTISIGLGYGDPGGFEPHGSGLENLIYHLILLQFGMSSWFLSVHESSRVYESGLLDVVWLAIEPLPSLRPALPLRFVFQNVSEKLPPYVDGEDCACRTEGNLMEVTSQDLKRIADALQVLEERDQVLILKGGDVQVSVSDGSVSE
jgi:hypothetical protein